MRRLRPTPLDLRQVHNLADWPVHPHTLRRRKDEGRVRHVGLTHYQAGSHDALQRIVDSARVDVVQVLAAGWQ